MNNNYFIADMKLKVCHKNDITLSFNCHTDCFLSNNDVSADKLDMTISFMQEFNENLFIGLDWFSIEKQYHYALYNNMKIIKTNDINDKTKIYAVIDAEWKNVSIYTNISKDFFFTYAISEILFRNLLIARNGMVIHSAAIKTNNNGIMFSAPSGTGKTTQANLWRKNRGAVVLNGDRPAVRFNDGIYQVYGTPWSGSSADFVADQAPLSAIVFLSQAPQNRVTRLSPDEAAKFLVPRCFLPFWNTELLNVGLDFAEKLVKAIPMYHMACLPDISAVECLEEALSL